MKSGQPHKFKVNLCLNQEEYPEGLHIHPKVVKADKIHLVPMFNITKNKEPDMCYLLATFTWNELGVSEVTGEGDSSKWSISCIRVHSLKTVKLVAFITL